MNLRKDHYRFLRYLFSVKVEKHLGDWCMRTGFIVCSPPVDGLSAVGQGIHFPLYTFVELHLHWQETGRATHDVILNRAF